MKCRVCGFDEEKVKEDSQRGFFQLIQEHPARGTEYREGTKHFGYVDRIIHLPIYACPKCGTLRVKHYEIED
jgi:rubredoxin